MVSEEEKKLVGQFQVYQQQLQAILLQKENLRLQTIEMEKALEELDASKGKKAYKIAGPIMIEKDIPQLKKELSERKSDIELRVKTLEKTEGRITDKLREIQPKLRKMIEK